MKRYLTGYSKGILTIRDRKTNQSVKHLSVTKEVADLFQSAVCNTNYNIKSKSHKTNMIDDVNYLNKTYQPFKASYGWIDPREIKWVKDDDEVKKINKSNNSNNDVELINELNELLGL